MSLRVFICVRRPKVSSDERLSRSLVRGVAVRHADRLTPFAIREATARISRVCRGFLPSALQRSDAEDSVQHLAVPRTRGRKHLDDAPLLDEGRPVGDAQRHLVILFGQQD